MAESLFTGTGDGLMLASEATATAARPKPARTKPALPGTGTTAPKVSRQELVEILAQACHDYAKNGGSVRVGMPDSGAATVIILAGDYYCQQHKRITAASTACQYCAKEDA